MNMWSELAEDDKDFQSEFNKLFDNPAVQETNEEFTSAFYNEYINKELILDQG